MQRRDLAIQSAQSALRFMTPAARVAAHGSQARRETRDDEDRAPPDRPKTAQRLTGRKGYRLGSCGFALSLVLAALHRPAEPTGATGSATIFHPGSGVRKYPGFNGQHHFRGFGALSNATSLVPLSKRVLLSAVALIMKFRCHRILYIFSSSRSKNQRHHSRDPNKLKH